MTYGSKTMQSATNDENLTWSSLDDSVTDLLDDLINAEPVCDSSQAVLFTGPDVETDEERWTREATAKAICQARCPARAACLAYALALDPEEGVWAGYTAEELREVRPLLSFLPRHRTDEVA
ncbi:Transcription factor WhiB [Nonomuraea maritima]|uniref:Transcriptional regulator WhiB n=1 Tax=Nonomuraea maritima TaxID=683260 RepID=A0A1G9SMY4_9ACTN|nr:WhiB family transcriptional regulator [Nonomuraea maritima]SDM36774.1 Transcription factor WhiB [Nonomuraea maritima]